MWKKVGFLPKRTVTFLNPRVSKKFRPGQWKFLIPLAGEGFSRHGKALFFRALAEFSEDGKK